MTENPNRFGRWPRVLAGIVGLAALATLPIFLGDEGEPQVSTDATQTAESAVRQLSSRQRVGDGERRSLHARVHVVAAHGGGDVAAAHLFVDDRDTTNTIDVGATPLAMTDAAGAAELEPHDAPRSLICVAAGHVPTAFSVAAGPGETVVRLASAHTLEVRARTESGRPIANARVMLSTRAVRPWAELPVVAAATRSSRDAAGAASDIPVWSARTDAQGLARIDHLPTDGKLRLYVFADGFCPLGEHGFGGAIEIPHERVDVTLSEMHGVIIRVASESDVLSQRWFYDKSQFDISPVALAWCMEAQRTLQAQFPDAAVLVRVPHTREPRVRFLARLANAQHCNTVWSMQPIRGLGPIFVDPEPVPAAGEVRVVVRTRDHEANDLPLRLITRPADPGIDVRSGVVTSVPAGEYRVVSRVGLLRKALSGDPVTVRVPEGGREEHVILIDRRPLKVICTATPPSPALRSPVVVNTSSKLGAFGFPNWDPKAGPLEMWIPHAGVRIEAHMHDCVSIDTTLAPKPEQNELTVHFDFRLRPSD